MEGGLPMLNCLLQHTLRSLCACQILPPLQSGFMQSFGESFQEIIHLQIFGLSLVCRWDHGGGMLDRAKGNKRNWILVWEDGFCDFSECERAGNGMFGADLFFKMTHEVYSFGEGLVGKVASDNSHKWVFRDSPTENDPTFISSWNVTIDPQPRAWEAQFSSGIEVVEDLNMVLSIQRKFSYIQSIPGIYTIQRPYLPVQNPNNFDHNNPHGLMQTSGTLPGFDDKQQMMGLKRENYEKSDDSPTTSIYLGYNGTQSGYSGALPLWSIPPLLPSMPCNLGAFFSRNPSFPVPYYTPQVIDHENTLLTSTDHEYRATFDEIPAVYVKLEETSCVQEEEGEEEKPRTLNQ
ncbi:UNVERIFIED_CONTAM: protein RICE SALT SENSITIVE 3 [Sesamum radiatum]|uniref:Protein RICE SALT SENSITIVE 3 n=1 Tax=Sesamum radiatum TaxID=300843 RepID=A0AAW2QF40_SESRA